MSDFDVKAAYLRYKKKQGAKALSFTWYVSVYQDLLEALQEHHSKKMSGGEDAEVRER